MEEGEEASLKNHQISNSSYGTTGEVSKPAGLTWHNCFFMILAYVIGAGVLGLPCSVAKLGWLPAAFAFSLTLVGFVLSASLYLQLFKAVPDAKCFGDVARFAFGRSGEVAASVLQLSWMVAFSALLHLTATLSLNQMLGRPDAKVSFPSATIAVLNFLLLQVRLTAVGHLTTISTVALIVACFVVFISFSISGRHDGAETQMSASPNQTAWGVSLSNLLCAFSGSHIWIELQSESSKPAEFHKAAWSATIITAVTYAIVGALGYYFIGKRELASGHPLTSYVSNGPVRAIVGFLLVLHVVPGYVLNGSLLIRNLVGLTEVPQTTGFGRQVRGLVASAVLVTFSWYTSTRIPFFNDLAGLCGALFLCLLTYTVPLALACKLVTSHPAVKASYAIIAVVSVIAAVFGTIACIDDLHSKNTALLEFLEFE